jgi:large subunit ribosomal protein L25
MSTILLEAESRTDLGKGASRRLRRLENKVLAIIYGGGKKPKSIHFPHNKVIKALETESIYSSVFDITVDGKTEHVILKALQRHPYKAVILHMDLQRVSAKDVLVKLVPVHFINEQESAGIKAGGLINHTMTQVEIRCQAKDLPQFIEVDMTNVGMDDVVHLSALKLPKGVHLTVDVTDGSHDAPVVSIHAPKVVVIEEEKEQEEGEGEEQVEVPASAVPTTTDEEEKSAE